MLHERIGIHHQWDVWRSLWTDLSRQQILKPNTSSLDLKKILVAYIGSFLGSTLFWKKHQSIFLYLYTVSQLWPNGPELFKGDWRSTQRLIVTMIFISCHTDCKHEQVED